MHKTCKHTQMYSVAQHGRGSSAANTETGNSAPFYRTEFPLQPPHILHIVAGGVCL